MKSTSRIQIAVPNFLKAQTCAKVARAKADMRSVAWIFQSKGADQFFARSASAGGSGVLEIDAPVHLQCDPTNGTISSGNIVRHGP